VTLTASRRLPGIRFEAQPPPPDDVLPRMDVAGFVGFAASGPLGVPVAIEDASQFAAIFGADAPLAWDDIRGEQVYAYLAPAVRSFFRNGGRRCWVIRVAGAAAASDLFEVPSVVGVRVDPAVQPPPAFVPAQLRAASPGSWADGLSLSSSITATALPFEDADPAAGQFTAVVSSTDEVIAGDVVRMRFAGAPWTLLLVVDGVAPAAPASPPSGGGARRLEVRGEQRFWLRPAELADGAAGAVTYLSADGEDVAITATAIAAAVAVAGDVRLRLGAGASQPPRAGSTVRGVFAGIDVLIEVDAVEASQVGAVVIGTAMAITAQTPAAVPTAVAAGIAERLELELRVAGGGRAPIVVSRLGFAPAHPRFLGALPDDAERFAPTLGFGGAVPATAAEAARRLPLAAPVSVPSCYLPLAATLRAGHALAALRPSGDARRRDGLEQFDADLFVDAELASTSTRRLIETADWLRDQSPSARRLHGIHALLDNDEVTIVAVPDAVHRDWSAGDSTEPAQPDVAAAQPALDWSRFRDCGDRIPAVPALTRVGDAESGAFTLSWTATNVDGATYELQESTEPDFAPAEMIHSGPGRLLDVHDRPAGFVLYYQVRAIAGKMVSDWSNRLLVRTAPAARWLLDASAAYDPAPLVALQLALLRMCAARGDMLAVLTLPEHYRERAAIAHVGALGGAGGALQGATRPGDPILGYGALYHPWLHAAEPEGPAALRLLPADGAAAGVLAGRGGRRGAWVAPANEPLRDVVALEPALPVAAHQRLQNAQINVVRREPGGFLWLSADTLSDNADVRPIGVRRLLQTVRRLALRHGDIMAFELNDDVARRVVQRSFRALLGRMFELGAFAGATTSEAFRVDTPVTPGDVDHGRLVVELRVAPARPLAFLTVRLVRSGAGTLQLEAL
jgi:hypothetical protein